jgi:hypothetical protein
MKRKLLFLLVFSIIAQAHAGQYSAEVVVAWNELAYEIGYGADQFRTFKALHSMTLMHLAMHDAINSVVPTYRPYAYRGPYKTGQPAGVAAQAAYDVLLAQYPDEIGKLDSELAKWITAGDDLEVGHRSAAAILSARVNDGWDLAGDYEFRSQPGEYRTTPDWNGFVLQPGFRFARPIAIARADQFRPPAPPALESPLYARAFKEVKAQGGIRSVDRTPDQTAYALWWMEFAEGSLNRLARTLSIDRRITLAEAARMFALLNASLYDTYIVTWDAKYEYNHWRPYTAIREAASDGNRKTESDEAWESLEPAPPFPEYTSAHAAACSSSFAVLEETFGKNVAFEMDTITATPGMKNRRFRNFRTAAAECADSRVQLGWHFRYATDAGLTLGRSVAKSVMRTHFRAESARP